VVAAAGLDEEDINQYHTQIVHHGGEVLGQEYTSQVLVSPWCSHVLWGAESQTTALCSIVRCPIQSEWHHTGRLNAGPFHLPCDTSGPERVNLALGAQCTHLLVASKTAPEVERARADGRRVVTDFWLEACVKKGALQPTAIPGFDQLMCVPSSPSSPSTASEEAEGGCSSYWCWHQSWRGGELVWSRKLEWHHLVASGAV
jgi:hypothetical protein